MTCVLVETQTTTEVQSGLVQALAVQWAGPGLTSGTPRDPARSLSLRRGLALGTTQEDLQIEGSVADSICIIHNQKYENSFNTAYQSVHRNDNL